MLTEKQPARGRRQYTPAEQARALAVVLREEFGVGFRFHTAADGAQVCPGEDGDEPGDLAPERVVAIAAGGRAELTPLPGGAIRVALPLSHAGRPVLVAVGELSAVAPGSAAEQARLQKWAQAVVERLRLADDRFTRPEGGASRPPSRRDRRPGRRC